MRGINVKTDPRERAVILKESATVNCFHIESIGVTFVNTALNEISVIFQELIKYQITSELVTGYNKKPFVNISLVFLL